MFNFRISGIAGGAAFVLSLLIGLIRGISFPMFLLRPLLFGAAFFALFCLIFWIFGQFLPELLTGTEDDLDIPAGSRVDITLGSPIEGAFPADNSETVDDIAGRPGVSRQAGQASSPGSGASPLDQGGQDMYNGDRAVLDGFGDFSAGISAGGESWSPGGGEGGNAGDGQALPDLETLSENFTPQGGGMDAGMAAFDTPEPKRSSTRKQGMAGDFNPQDLARAIQTVLKKDEKG